MKPCRSEACRHLVESISDYIDGSLDESLCAELEKHLEGCVNCRVVVDTMRKTVELYQMEADEEIPADVRSRLYMKLNLDEYLK